LVDGHIDRVSSKGRKPGGPKMVTFSLRLGEREHARLVWLAERLETAKTPLAEGLLNAAVEEAIEQYAEWAAPEDPESYIEEALAEAERLERRSGGPGSRPGVGPPKKPGPRHHG
jgi:predicted transcriptional regulator